MSLCSQLHFKMPSVQSLLHRRVWSKLPCTWAGCSMGLTLRRNIEIKFVTPTAAHVDASPGRPLYICPKAELSTSELASTVEHFHAGQRISGIVRPDLPRSPLTRLVMLDLPRHYCAKPSLSLACTPIPDGSVECTLAL